MKRVCILFLIVILLFSLTACKSETIPLHCDGENCNNMVDIKVEKDNTPDESWVVFCQDCADNDLND